eukprot:scpid36236/ scgid5776/ 
MDQRRHTLVVVVVVLGVVTALVRDVNCICSPWQHVQKSGTSQCILSCDPSQAAATVTDPMDSDDKPAHSDNGSAHTLAPSDNGTATRSVRQPPPNSTTYVFSVYPIIQACRSEPILPSTLTLTTSKRCKTQLSIWHMNAANTFTVVAVSSRILHACAEDTLASCSPSISITDLDFTKIGNVPVTFGAIIASQNYSTSNLSIGITVRRAQKCKGIHYMQSSQNISFLNHGHHWKAEHFGKSVKMETTHEVPSFHLVLSYGATQTNSTVISKTTDQPSTFHTSTRHATFTPSRQEEKQQKSYPVTKLASQAAYPMPTSTAAANTPPPCSAQLPCDATRTQAVPRPGRQSSPLPKSESPDTHQMPTSTSLHVRISSTLQPTLDDAGSDLGTGDGSDLQQNGGSDTTKVVYVGALASKSLMIALIGLVIVFSLATGVCSTLLLLNWFKSRSGNDSTDSACKSTHSIRSKLSPKPNRTTTFAIPVQSGCNGHENSAGDVQDTATSNAWQAEVGVMASDYSQPIVASDSTLATALPPVSHSSALTKPQTAAETPKAHAVLTATDSQDESDYKVPFETIISSRNSSSKRRKCSLPGEPSSTAPPQAALLHDLYAHIDDVLNIDAGTEEQHQSLDFSLSVQSSQHNITSPGSSSRDEHSSRSSEHSSGCNSSNVCESQKDGSANIAAAVVPIYSSPVLKVRSG